MTPGVSRILKAVLVPVVAMLLLLSCGLGGPDVPDVSGSSVNITVERFDKEFLAVDPATLDQRGPELAEEYGNFYTVYAQHMMGFGPINDSATHYNMSDFISNRFVKEFQADIEGVYPNEDALNQEFTEAFSLYEHYFPGRPIPRIIAMNTGMSYPIAAIDSFTLGLGLDFYLGRDYAHYKDIQGLNQYQIRKMEPENAVTEAVRGWIETEFERPEDHNQLLQIILQAGKHLYALERCMPYKHDSTLIGFSTSQEEWCHANEFNMWAHFIEEERLYTTDVNEIRTYTQDAPFTSGLARESPGRIGLWLGWQIVRAYMKQHPETPLPELMKPSDAQEFLGSSGYKPSR